MILQECIRYYKSKFSILLTIILTIIVLGSYYSTYLQKEEWLKVLHSGSNDVNLQKVSDMVSGYTGIYFFENFIFSNDYYVVFWIVLLLGFGIGIGSSMFNSLQSNYGTMIVTRMSYKKYLNKILIAQVIYMSTYVIVFFLLTFFFSLIVINGNFQVPPNSIIKDLSIINYLAVLFSSIVHILFFIILIILITTLSPLYLSNKYVIQIFPFFIVIISNIIFTFIGNINNALAMLSSVFVFEQIIFSIKDIFITSKSTLTLIFTGGSFIIICFFVFIITYRANLKRFEQDYIV